MRHSYHPDIQGRLPLAHKRCHKHAEHRFDIGWYAIELHVLRDQLDIALKQTKLPDVPCSHCAWQDRLGGVAPLVEGDQLHGELGETPGKIGMFGFDNQQPTVGVEVVIQRAFEVFGDIERIFNT
jgi:hypothetical protein